MNNAPFFSTNEDDHRRQVNNIALQVRQFAGRGGPLRVSKGGVPHVVPLARDRRRRDKTIDISGLNHILNIDRQNMRAVCEPGVTFAQLAQATLAQGMIPFTVPELEGITVGGAISGCSVESMSYRHGGFHDTCLEYELISGTGEIITCSPSKEPLLFHMTHGSYGTLGILTKATFALRPAQPFVHMKYLRYKTAEEYFAALRERCATAQDDFIDGIVHGPDHFVICLGQLVDSAPYVSNYRWLNIFYRSTASRDEDYLTTYDYFFRYDTECHWLTRTVPGLESKPIRFSLGKFLLGS